MNKKVVWMLLVLFWIACAFVSYKVILHYGLLEKPMSEVGIGVE
jgi:hypothetical protein